nr:hypothetical protein CFP56_58109 [Quercus suber]
MPSPWPWVQCLYTPVLLELSSTHLDVSTLESSSAHPHTDACGTGLRGYGLPNATSENALVFPSATGRNLGAGFFVLTMTMMGERKVLGVFVTCWAWAGVADCKILFQHPQGRNRVKHMVNTVVVLILGPLLIRS